MRALALLLVVLLVLPATGRASTVAVSGQRVWDESRVTGIVGTPPADPDALPKWADEALARLIDAYTADGYTAARGWTRVTGDHVDVEIDEGRVSGVAFRGSIAMLQFLASEAVRLPEGVFHAPTVEAQIAAVGALRGLHGVGFTIRDGDEWVSFEIPGVVRGRMLVIEAPTVEQVGFGLDIAFLPVYGLVVTPSWAEPDLAAEGDRLYAAVGFAFPLHEYVWETDPKARWVYGDVAIEYRMRKIGQSLFSPRFGTRFELVQTPRLDLGLDQMMYEDTTLRIDVVASRTERWRLSAGFVGGQWAVLRSVFSQDVDPDTIPDHLLEDAVRLGVTAGLEAWPQSPILRKDLRPAIEGDAVIAWAHTNEAYFRLVGTGRTAVPLRSHVLVLGVNFGVLAGDVRAYDALRVAGEFQRVFFQDRYYTRYLSQGEVALRFKILHELGLGVYYQQSVFEDTNFGGGLPRIDWMNSFGPALHLLLADQFAVDVYWAMGVGPESWLDVSPSGTRFAQTVSFGLQSVY